MGGTPRNKASNHADGGSRKAERLVYQLSCKKCKNTHGSYVGATSTDLTTTVEAHVDRVVKAVASKGKVGAERGGATEEKWTADFVLHFAEHCKPKNKLFRSSMPKKEVIDFCHKNIKVELLKSKRGVELCWECDEFTDVHRSLLARRGRDRKAAD